MRATRRQKGTGTLFKVVFGGEGELGGDELEAAFLESGEDLADETAVDAVGLFDGFGGSVGWDEEGTIP